MFAGDLLFAGSIGRTDLPGGDHPAMLRSLADKVLPLDDQIVVLPGHGDQTTIGQERKTNPYLQGLVPGPPGPPRRCEPGETQRTGEHFLMSFQAPKGTYDIVPPDSATWLAVREALAAAAATGGLRVRRDAHVRRHGPVRTRRR